MCTYQYAELGLFFTMPFVGIRIILVLRLSFAVSKTDEILSLSAGDQIAGSHILFLFLHVFLNNPNESPYHDNHDNANRECGYDAHTLNIVHRTL